MVPWLARARGLAVRRLRCACAVCGQAAAYGADRVRESVEHRLRAKLVVQCVAMHAQRLRRLRHIAAAGLHGRHDVLALEGLYGLFESDATTNQFTNDLIQTIIDT